MTPPHGFLPPLLTGVVVGLSSWLPIGVDSGVVLRLLSEIAPGYSNYMVPSYLGVAFAVLFYFRDIIGYGTQRALRRSFSSELKYFVYASLFTIAVGYPLTVSSKTFLGPVTADAVNAVVGLLIAAIGLLCWRGKKEPLRSVEENMNEEDGPTLLDAFTSGTAQGVAMLNGLSPTGLVMLALSSTGTDARKALELLFLISPVYLTMKLLFMSGWNSGMPIWLPFSAFLSSFTTALLFMKGLLYIAGKSRRRTFLTVFGLIAPLVYTLEVVL